MSTERQGGRILVEQLIVHGADTVFSVPGETTEKWLRTTTWPSTGAGAGTSASSSVITTSSAPLMIAA